MFRASSNPPRNLRTDFNADFSDQHSPLRGFGGIVSIVLESYHLFGIWINSLAIFFGKYFSPLLSNARPGCRQA
jgi:hypothetical protein